MKLAINGRILMVGLLAYVVVLALNFPADRAYAHLKSAKSASRNIVLAGISGSVWSGKADMALLNGNRLENLEWTLRPWPLLLARVGLSWRFQLPSAQVKGTQSEGGYGQGVSSLGLDGSIAFSSLEAQLPATLLTAMARLGALRPSGSVNLNLHDVLWDGQGLVSAAGRIVWRDAGVSLIKPVSFGDLSLDLETANDQVKGVLADNGGPLSAEGLIVLSADGSYQFNGAFGARGNNELGNALRSMGRPGPDGKVKINYSGNLVALGILPVRAKK